MSTSCTNCPTCRLFLDVAREAYRRNRYMRVCALCCAAIALMSSIAAVLVYLCF